MALHVGTSKLEALERTLATFVAPLDAPGEEEWLARVGRRVAELFEADAVVSVLAGSDGDFTFHFRGADPEVGRTLRDVALGGERGRLRFRYSGLDRMLRRLAAAGVQVWTPELGERLTGVRVDEMAFTHEVAAPAGILHQASMAVPLPRGAALVAFSHEAADRDPFGDERIPLLRLLLPALRSGVGSLMAFRERREALEEHLESDPDALLAFDPDGNLLHRNRAARALFRDPDRELLLREAERIAGQAEELRTAPRKSGRDPPRLLRDREVASGSERFRLSAIFLPAGLLGRDWALLVRVARLTPALPSVEEIHERTGLTVRQAEVARLIARDLTSAEIAERLGISVHTVRRHAERILPGLGVRSRKGVAARLLRI